MAAPRSKSNQDNDGYQSDPESEDQLEYELDLELELNVAIRNQSEDKLDYRDTCDILNCAVLTGNINLIYWALNQGCRLDGEETWLCAQLTRNQDLIDYVQSLYNHTDDYMDDWGSLGSGDDRNIMDEYLKSYGPYSYVPEKKQEPGPEDEKFVAAESSSLWPDDHAPPLIYSELEEALRRHDLYYVTQLLDGREIKMSEHTLNCALMAGYRNIIELLIEKGAQANEDTLNCLLLAAYIYGGSYNEFAQAFDMGWMPNEDSLVCAQLWNNEDVIKFIREYYEKSKIIASGKNAILIYHELLNKYGYPLYLLEEKAPEQKLPLPLPSTSYDRSLVLALGRVLAKEGLGLIASKVPAELLFEIGSYFINRFGNRPDSS